MSTEKKPQEKTRLHPEFFRVGIGTSQIRWRGIANRDPLLLPPLPNPFVWSPQNILLPVQCIEVFFRTEFHDFPMVGFCSILKAISVFQYFKWNIHRMIYNFIFSHPAQCGPIFNVSNSIRIGCKDKFRFCVQLQSYHEA